jgi:hypothetical protein
MRVAPVDSPLFVVLESGAVPLLGYPSGLNRLPRSREERSYRRFYEHHFEQGTVSD